MPAARAQALKEEVMVTARVLDAKLKEAQRLAAELIAKLEGEYLALYEETAQWGSLVQGWPLFYEEITT